MFVHGQLVGHGWHGHQIHGVHGHWQLLGPLVVIGVTGGAVDVVVGGVVTSCVIVTILSSHVGQFGMQAIGAGGGLGVALQLLVHSLGWRQRWAAKSK